MELRGKSIDDLRSELELIDRTILALERLGQLRMDSTAVAPKNKPAAAHRRTQKMIESR